MFLQLFGLPFSFVTMFWVLKYTSFKDVGVKPGERTTWLRVLVDLPEGQAGF